MASMLQESFENEVEDSARWRRTPAPFEPAAIRRDRRRAARRRIRRRIRIVVVRSVVTSLVVPALAIGSLAWFDPPISRFMADNPADVVQQSTDVEDVSRYFLVLAMGQEDQDLPDRIAPFEWDAFVDRVRARLAGKPDSSGSTIPQQLAKNLFLTADQSAARKGVEAVLATGLSLLLPDSRVLELYVNFAQFAPQVYGVCAASWYYFGHSSRTMTVDEAAQLVGLLPSPLHVHRGPDGGLAFDEPDVAGELNVSASTVLWAQAHAQTWFDQMGGFEATERMGIEGLAADRPAEADRCADMPDGVAELIAAGPTG